MMSSLSNKLTWKQLVSISAFLIPIIFIFLSKMSYSQSIDAPSMTIELRHSEEKVAIPGFILKGIETDESFSNKNKSLKIEKIARIQAEIKCKQQQCGSLLCNNLLDETHSRQIFSRNRTTLPVHLKDDHRIEDFLNNLDQSRTYGFEIYFEKIRCLYSNHPKSLTMLSKILSELPTPEANSKIHFSTSPFETVLKILTTLTHTFQDIKEKVKDPTLRTHAFHFAQNVAFKGALEYMTHPIPSDSVYLALSKHMLKQSGIPDAIGGYMTKSITKNRHALAPSLATGITSEILYSHEKWKAVHSHYLRDLQKNKIFSKNIESLDQMLANLEGNISQATLLVQNSSHSNPFLIETKVKEFNKRVNATLNYIEEVLNLPKISRKFSEDANEKMNLFFNSREYQQKTKNGVQKFVTEIDRNSRSPSLIPISPAFAYLVGQSGAGKTTLANGITGSLGIPYFELKISESLTLTSFRRKLLQGIKNSGVNNPIVQLDEFGDLFKTDKNQEMLAFLQRELLDPEGPSIEISPPEDCLDFNNVRPMALPTFIDASHITYIASGTHPVPDEYPFMQRRMNHRIEIPKISLDLKIKIATQELINQFSQIYDRPFANENLGTRDYNFISEAAEMDNINYDGVDQLKKVIAAYANHQAYVPTIRIEGTSEGLDFNLNDYYLNN